MAFTHHSHSGQFCGHAANTLEEVVIDAISKGMHTLCMTEHVPRDAEDFYPEEKDAHDVASLAKLFDDYCTEARRLQKAYASQITIFVGFEGEWIRDASLGILRDLMAKHQFDMFIGSVHHVHTQPIDYDSETYRKAREIAGGSDRQLFGDYFDSQLEMLRALHPPVVGHFDLIRLKSDDPNGSFQVWPDVWSKILRNLKFIAEYGGLLELNSSSLRKGMAEPYPKTEICQAFLAVGGGFTLSDDSHGIAQVGLNFRLTLESAQEAGIATIYHLERKARSSADNVLYCSGFDQVMWRGSPIQDALRSLSP